MNSFVDLCAIALGIVFEWSGTMKVVSGDKWQVAGTPFATGSVTVDGLVRRWLPWIELALGITLIFRMSPRFFGTLAFLLLVGFTASLVRVISSGQRPPCLCFGSSRARPVSWKTIARNVVLIACAVTTIVGG